MPPRSPVIAEVDTESIIRNVKEQIVNEFKHRCVIWNDITEDSAEEDLPPKFERVCNQDGDPVFRDSEGTWKSVVTGKRIEVSSWCELPKRSATR